MSTRQIKLLVSSIVFVFLMLNACSTAHHNTPEVIQKGENNTLIYKSPGAGSK